MLTEIRMKLRLTRNNQVLVDELKRPIAGIVTPEGILPVVQRDEKGARAKMNGPYMGPTAFHANDGDSLTISGYVFPDRASWKGKHRDLKVRFIQLDGGDMMEIRRARTSRRGVVITGLIPG